MIDDIDDIYVVDDVDDIHDIHDIHDKLMIRCKNLYRILLLAHVVPF